MAELQHLAYKLRWLQEWILVFWILSPDYVVCSTHSIWTKFIGQSPSWEANSHSASASYGTRRSITVFTKARHLSLSWVRCFQSSTSHTFSLRTILISSHLFLGFPSDPFGLSDQNFIRNSYLSHACYIPRSSYPPLFDCLDNVWWSVQVMRLLNMQSSPDSCHFLPLRYKLWQVAKLGVQCLTLGKYVDKGVSKSFQTGRLERELQMVQLSATRCSCIAILWVSLVSFAAITLSVASQQVFIIVVLFRHDSVRKLLDTPSYVFCNCAKHHC
jgi:hypothetical protein